MSETANYGAGTSIRIVPEVAYLNRQANELAFAGKTKSARAIYDQALGIDPSSATTWHNKGCCLDELGEYAGAVECFDQAIRIDPYNAESWFNKGMCQKRMGKMREADQSVEHAIRLAQGLED
jgi:tetratricopeptide (TPR) repeat protein